MKSKRHQKAARVRWARKNPQKPQSVRLEDSHLEKITRWRDMLGSSGSDAIRRMIELAPDDPPAA